MRLRRVLSTCLLAVVALAATASIAGAAPVLSSPAAGATITTSFPTFQWTLDAGQDYIGVRISNKPDVGADGSLASSVQSYYPDAAKAESLTSFTPDAKHGLVAGTWYWQLQVFDSDQAYLSPVQSFTVAKQTLFVGLKGNGSAKAQKLFFQPRFTVNAEYVNARFELWRGRTRIGKPDTMKVYNAEYVGRPRSMPLTYSPSGFDYKKGEVYTIKVRISANGITRNRTVNITVR